MPFQRGNKIGSGWKVPVLMSGGAAAPYFQDNFTDTNGTALGSHTPAPYNTPGTTWTIHAQTIEINGNRAKTTSGAIGCASVDLGLASLSLAIDATTKTAAGDAGPFGMAVRTVDASNTWIVGVSKDAQAFRIVERNGASNTNRAGASVTVGNSVTYAIAVTLNGNTITATIDGGDQIQYASASFQNTATRHGVFWNEMSGAANQFGFYDNFRRTDA